MLSSKALVRASSFDLTRSPHRFSSVEVIRTSSWSLGVVDATSSEAPEKTVAELIAEADKELQEQQGEYIDRGLPIPETYNIDTIRTMVQDPFHIWVYWTMRDRLLDGVKKIFPKEIAATFTPVLKVTEMILGHTSIIEINRNGNYWLSVFPDRHYRIEVGVQSPLRGYIRLLEADEVRTPRGTISMQVAQEPEFKVTNQEFAENLRLSGFASFAGVMGPAQIVQDLPDDVSDIISTAASGEELSDEQIDKLPPRIRSLMLELRERGDEELTSIALLHLLPEYLREAVDEAEELFDDALHPQHLSPRFTFGSSEHRPIPERKPWMPSMAERPSSPTKSSPQRKR